MLRCLMKKKLNLFKRELTLLVTSTLREIWQVSVPRCAVHVFCWYPLSFLYWPCLFVCLSPQHYPHREHEGRIVLLGGLSRDVKYNIKGCHGCDCRIRQIYMYVRLRGFRYDTLHAHTHTHTHTLASCTFSSSSLSSVSNRFLIQQYWTSWLAGTFI